MVQARCRRRCSPSAAAAASTSDLKLSGTSSHVFARPACTASERSWGVFLSISAAVIGSREVALREHYAVFRDRDARRLSCAESSCSTAHRADSGRGFTHIIRDAQLFDRVVAPGCVLRERWEGRVKGTIRVRQNRDGSICPCAGSASPIPSLGSLRPAASAVHEPPSR